MNASTLNIEYDPANSPAFPWTVSGDAGAPVSNNDVERAVKVDLDHVWPGFVDHVQFDSESSCFFAYCDDEKRALDLVMFVEVAAARFAPGPTDADDEEGAEVIEQEHADGHEGGFPVR